MIHYEQCPVCAGNRLRNFLQAKDYTVSGENFSLLQCEDCGLVFTQAVAPQNEMGKYYQSANYISHSDTQQGIVNKLYHRVRKITLGSKRKLILDETGLATGTLLDI